MAHAKRMNILHRDFFLLLCIIAMLCGVESIENITFFGITHMQWLKQYLKLPNGIPSADTILRVY